MAVQAMWVPGFAAVAQIPGGGGALAPEPMTNVDGHAFTDIVGFRQGSGVTFRGKAERDNWFHFAIPTPCFRSDSGVTDGHAQLARIFVLFKLSDPAKVTNVHVWDGPGPRPLRKFDGLSVRGDRSLAINYGTDPTMDSNTWNLDDQPQVRYGIGLSVRVEFGGRDGDVLFTAAGADFIV